MINTELLIIGGILLLILFYVLHKLGGAGAAPQSRPPMRHTNVFLIKTKTNSPRPAPPKPKRL